LPEDLLHPQLRVLSGLLTGRCRRLLDPGSVRLLDRSLFWLAKGKRLVLGRLGGKLSGLVT
jgi:hypothetical protein